MKKYTLILSILLLSQVKGVYASLGNVNGYMTPATKTISVGETFSAKIMLDSGNYKLSGINVSLNIDSSKLKVLSVVPNHNAFENVILKSSVNNLVNLYIVSFKKSAELPSGVIELGTVTLGGVQNSTSVVDVKANWEVVGVTTSNDNNYTLVWQNANYTVGSVINGTDQVLNYKVALANVNPNSAKCIVSPPLKFMIVGGGQSRTYADVLPQTSEVVGSKLIFGGSLALTGFTATNSVAVFVSGPKHLQTKYGRADQSTMYDKAGGELTLTKNSSPVYDFSNYPMLAGDVVSNNSQTSQDGNVNGVDFAYVKSQALIHKTVLADLQGKPEGFLRADLNGDCQVNSNDVNIMKITLQDKQGQMY